MTAIPLFSRPFGSPEYGDAKKESVFDQIDRGINTLVSTTRNAVGFVMSQPFNIAGKALHLAARTAETVTTYPVDVVGNALEGTAKNVKELFSAGGGHDAHGGHNAHGHDDHGEGHGH